MLATYKIIDLQYNDASGQGMVFTPYYSVAAGPLNGAYENEFYYAGGRIPELMEAVRDILLPDVFLGVDYLANYSIFAHSGSGYLQISPYTSRGLLRIAREAGIELTEEAINGNAEQIDNAERLRVSNMVADYISSAAKYTLSPHIVPDNEDFALYFLENAKEGYCIHFATAAALMLRSLGIPARITSGFVVSVSKDNVNKPVNVTDRNAHAWVEVYYNEIGWLPLEVTPAAAGGGIYDGRSPGVVSGNETETPNESAAAPTQNPRPEEEVTTQPEDQPSESVPSAAESANAGAGGTQGRSTTGLPGFFRLLIYIASAVLSINIYRFILRKVRKRRFALEDANLSVIFAWRFLQRLNKIAIMPESLENTALKARFSSHQLSEEERHDMIANTRLFVAEVFENSGFFTRLWLKWAICV